MGTTAEAVKNQEEGADDLIVIDAPEGWVFDAGLLDAIFVAYNLGIKELRMFMTFILLHMERINGTRPGGIRLLDLKKLLGIGFQHDSDFRTVRKRLERVNLLTVERNSLPGVRGGSRNKYSLVQLPNRQFSAGQSGFKELYKKNITINDTTKGNAKDENKSYIGESVTKNILDGVADWEAPPLATKKVDRGSTSAAIETWSGAHRLNYFLERYRALHGTEYILSQGRGVHERRIMDLPTGNEVYRDFIDWLFSKRDLKSINFLPEQYNNYIRENVVAPQKRLEAAVRGEFYKVRRPDGVEVAVVHQYAGFEVVNKQVLALDAIEAGFISAAQVAEWDLCPKNVLIRMGLLNAC
jgi:hypothetical protein